VICEDAGLVVRVVLPMQEVFSLHTSTYVGTWSYANFLYESRAIFARATMIVHDLVVLAATQAILIAIYSGRPNGERGPYCPWAPPGGAAAAVPASTSTRRALVTW
jgi:hypothetical protein